MARLHPLEERSTRSSDRDAELVARTLAGEEAAFEALHRRYRPRIERFIGSRIGDGEEARDLTQDTFLAMYRGLASYEGRSSLWGWLCGIAHYRVCRHWRNAGRVVPLDASDGVLDRAAPARTEEALDARRALERCQRAARERLSPGARRIFRLRYVQGRPIRAVAALCERNEGSTRAALLRARHTLRAAVPAVDALVRE